MSPRWSILLPTHDRAEVVGFAIRSVLAQSDGDWELLVVGDGCTDGTADVVQGFEDERIRWFDLPKAPGFGYANRNVALREARGELVGFMAHDDLLLPDHLELMGPLFERARVEWAYSRPLWVEDDGTIIPFAVDLCRPAELERFLAKGNRIPASCVVHRRELLERVGGWSETRLKAGDFELWSRMIGASRGANIDYQPLPTCLHFRAIWKTGPEWGPAPLERWQRTAYDGWWPPALRQDVPDGVLPQAHVLGRMEQEGPAWSEACRSATVSVVDGFAWDAAMAQPRLERRLVDAARALVRGERFSEAMAVVEAAQDVAPASAALAAVRSAAALGTEDHTLAEVAARRAVELDPTLVRGHRLLARALEAQGRTTDALEVLTAAVRVVPDHGGLWAQLGALRLRSGDREGAEDAAAQATRLAPDATTTQRLRTELAR